jgi:hypothetical protein
MLRSMQSKGKPKTIQKTVSLFLVFLLTFSLFGTVFAADPPPPAGQSATVAMWNYNVAPASPDVAATSGVNQDNAVLRNSLGVTPGYSSSSLVAGGSQGAYAGAWSVDGYWEFRFSALDFEDLTFSASQRSSGTGPRDFELRYSTDGLTWTPIGGSDVAVNSTSLSSKYSDFALPDALEGLDTAYLRLVITSDISSRAGTGSYGAAETMAAGGTTNINGVIISGVYVGGNTNPAIDKSELEAAIALASAAGYDEADYTVESWAEFAAALDSAIYVLGHDDAIAKDVSEALDALNDAIAGLTEKQPSPGDPDPLTFADLMISVGGDESELMFTWYTAQASGELAIRAQGDAGFETIDAAGIQKGANHIHRATATGLTPATVYEYRLMGEENTASDIFTVKTGGADGFSFIAVGDPQIGSSNTENDTGGWVNTMSRVTAAFPDAGFMISAGDQVETANNTAQYAGYLKPDALKSLPTSNAVGNHDSGNALFTDHFQMPNATKVGTGATNYDWWYTYNNTLFMFIDANYRSTTAGHKTMMEEAIAANPDATWKVVVFHQGPYTNASHSDNDGYGFRTNWTPMFDDLGIDVVLNGHDHSYTRAFQMYGDNPQKDQQWINESGEIVSDETGLMYNKVLNPTGTAYFELNSASGSKFYALKAPQYFVAKQVQSNTANFSIVDVTDDSFTVTTYKLDGVYNGTEHEVIDAYTIYKGAGAPDPSDNPLAAIRASETSLVTEPVEYTVSLSGLDRVKTVELSFTADGNFLEFKELAALNGFTTLTGADVAWTELGDGLWQGKATLIYGYGEQTTITSEAPVDVVKIIHNAKALGNASMTLTGVSATGFVTGIDGKNTMGMIACDIDPENAGAVTSIVDDTSYLIFDLNKDGAVNQIDLAIVALYCGIADGDPRWDALVIVYDANDAAITASLCDVNDDGNVNMLDLLDLFMNYTR